LELQEDTARGPKCRSFSLKCALVATQHLQQGMNDLLLLETKIDIELPPWALNCVKICTSINLDHLSYLMFADFASAFSMKEPADKLSGGIGSFFRVGISYTGYDV
jgi:hypothetical protein